MWKGLQVPKLGLYPNVISEASFDSPFITGILAAIPSEGVFEYLPPNGISTDLAPIVESNLSTNPCCDAIFKSFKFSSHLSLTLTVPTLYG